MTRLLRKRRMGDVQRSAIRASQDDARPMVFRSQLKVFKAIVKAIAVDVMHRLGRSQQSTEVFFHDDAMFRHAFSVRVWVFRLVEIGVATAHSAVPKMPVRFAELFDSMPTNKRIGVSAEVSLFRVRDFRDRCRATTSAFAQAGRNFFWLWYVTPGEMLSTSVPMADQKSRRVPAIVRGWNRQTAPASTNERTNGSNHMTSICYFSTTVSL